MPQVICDTDGIPVDPATAKKIIAEQWIVPAEVHARRRSPTLTPSNRAATALNKSTQGMTGQTPEGSTNEATFPQPQRARPANAGQDNHLTAHRP
jgi:hypothetical protein